MKTELSRRLTRTLYAADSFGEFAASLEMLYPVGFFSHALEPICLPDPFGDLSLAEHTPYTLLKKEDAEVYSITDSISAQDLALNGCYAGSILYGAPLNEIDAEDTAAVKKAFLLALRLFDITPDTSSADMDAFLAEMQEPTKDLFCVYFDIPAQSRIAGKLRCELVRSAEPMFSCRCGGGVAFLFDEDITASEKFLSVVEKFNCRMGCSGPFVTSHLAIGCTEKARRAAEFSSEGAKVKRFRDVRWDSLCKEASFVLREQGYQVEDFLHDGLLRLLKSDTESATDYFESLYAYLSHGKSLRVAAEKLNLHRNTLDYRIRRIGELFDLDLEDQNTCFELLFSCRLYLSFLKGGSI